MEVKKKKKLARHTQTSSQQIFRMAKKETGTFSIWGEKPNSFPVKPYIYLTCQRANTNPPVTLMENFKWHSKTFKWGLKSLQRGPLKVSHQSVCDCELVYSFLLCSCVNYQLQCYWGSQLYNHSFPSSRTGNRLNRFVARGNGQTVFGVDASCKDQGVVGFFLTFFFPAIHLLQERGAKEKIVSQFRIVNLERMSSKPGQMIRKVSVLPVWSQPTPKIQAGYSGQGRISLLLPCFTIFAILLKEWEKVSLLFITVCRY